MSEGQKLEISALVKYEKRNPDFKAADKAFVVLCVMFVAFKFLLIIVHIVVCFLDLLKSTLLKQSLFQ